MALAWPICAVRKTAPEAQRRVGVLGGVVACVARRALAQELATAAPPHRCAPIFRDLASPPGIVGFLLTSSCTSMISRPWGLLGHIAGSSQPEPPGVGQSRTEPHRADQSRGKRGREERDNNLELGSSAAWNLVNLH